MRKSTFTALILMAALIAVTTSAKAKTRPAPVWQDTMGLAAQSDDPDTRPVITAPEPGSMLLFGSGLVLLGLFLRRLLHANAKGK